MSNPASLNWFDRTPDCAYLRVWQLIGSKQNPDQPKLLPVSRATLWRMVKKSKFPAPQQIGPNTTVWLCGDVRKWLEQKAKIQDRAKA